MGEYDEALENQAKQNFEPNQRKDHNCSAKLAFGPPIFPSLQLGNRTAGLKNKVNLPGFAEDPAGHQDFAFLESPKLLEPPPIQSEANNTCFQLH